MQTEHRKGGQFTLVLSKTGPEDTSVYTGRVTNYHGETCSAELLFRNYVYGVHVDIKYIYKM